VAVTRENASVTYCVDVYSEDWDNGLAQVIVSGEAYLIESGPEFVHVSVKQVAREALVALEADRPLVIPGFIMKLGMFLVRITPISILRLASRFSAKRD